MLNCCGGSPVSHTIKRGRPHHDSRMPSGVVHAPLKEVDMSDQRTSRRPNEGLKRERLLRGWRQQDVADRIGTDGYTVSRWERGRATPSPYFRQQLCDLFGKNAEALGLLSAQPKAETARPLSSEAVGHPEHGGDETHHAQDVTALPPYWNVPYQRNPFFTGREQILQQLHQLLRRQQTVALTHSYALSGLGGIGKTQIAVEYAYRSFQDYSAVFWLGAETAESLQAGFHSIATLLRLPEHLEPDQRKLVAAVIHWLNSHRDWLLILDNVEDVDLVKSFLPAARQGSLLFTTRLPALGTLARTVEVAPMSSEEGRHLLLRRADAGSPQAALEGLAPQDERAIQALATFLDGLPLALDQAGAYIANTRCSWATFLHFLQTAPLQVLNERDASAEHPLSIVRTFTLSFERLQPNHPAAAELLTLCCFLAPDAIPEALITAPVAQLSPSLQSVVPDPFHFNALLQELLAYALISRSAQAGTILIHRLVQVVLKQRMPAALQREWSERVLRLVNQVFPPDPPPGEEWVWCEQVLPHAMHAVGQYEQGDSASPELMCLLTKLASYLSLRARYREAQLLYQRTLALQEQTLGPTHPEVAASLNHLAELTRKLGKYKEAKELYQRALALLEQMADSDQVQVASSLHGLATVFASQGRHGEAEPFLLRSLGIREQTRGAEHPEVATSLNNLAELYLKQGRDEEAVPLSRRALLLREQAHGPEHPDLAFPLNTLAELYVKQGRDEEAESFLLQALRILEQGIGPDYPEVVYPLRGLARLYGKRGRYQEAESLLQRARRLWEHTMGSEHPEMAPLLQELASLSGTQGRYEEAERLYQRALAIWEQRQEPHHPELQECLKHYALLQRQRQQGKAENGE
jgi:tetratricopeptide (TPR) repeat protein